MVAKIKKGTAIKENLSIPANIRCRTMSVRIEVKPLNTKADEAVSAINTGILNANIDEKFKEEIPSTKGAL